MKNFFTTVRLPHRVGGELGQCISVLSELISQLRVTLNAIDLDNMTPELRKRLSLVPSVHCVKKTEAMSTSSYRKGDIVLVYEPAGELSPVEQMYVYTGEGLE